MPRTYSKKIKRCRSYYIRCRGRKTRVDKRKKGRRSQRRRMRGGVKTKSQITYSGNKQARGVRKGPLYRQGVERKEKMIELAEMKAKQGTKNPNAPNAKNLPDSTKFFGIPEEEKETKMKELAEMKAKQKKKQITFDDDIKQDKNQHNRTDKKLNNQLSDLRKMIGQTSTSQSSIYGMTCVEPIPNSPGSYKVLDKDGIRKHLIT